MTNPSKKTGPPPTALTIRPVGVEIFTDLQRGKRFVRLSFRRRDVTQARALAFVGELLADLTRAGLVVTADVEAALSLDNAAGKARTLQATGTRCKINVKVQVQPQDEDAAEAQEWADRLRAQWLPDGADAQEEG